MATSKLDFPAPMIGAGLGRPAAALSSLPAVCEGAPLSQPGATASLRSAAFAPLCPRGKWRGPLEAVIKAAVLAGLVTLALAAAFPLRAAAQDAATARPRVQFTSPFLAAPGEQVLVCAANVSEVTGHARTLRVTLELLSAVSGTVKSRGELALPPLGSVEHPPDPCIEFAVNGEASSVPSPSLLMAVVELSPQPLPPGFRLPRVLTASVQIVSSEAAGERVRGVAFHPPEPCLSAACRPASQQ